MAKRRLCAPAVAALFTAGSLLGAGTTSAADAPTVTAGNGIYQLTVSNAGAPAAGTVTASTGATNPFGKGISLLFGGGTGSPSTSYASVHVYPSGGFGEIDYTQGIRGGGSFALPVTKVEPIGTTGERVLHDLGSFSLTEAVNAEGSTFENSVITDQLTLTNNTSSTVRFGLRLLLDAAVGGDDGPVFQLAGQPVTTKATSYPSPPLNTTWRYADNDTNPAPLPTFAVVGTTTPRPQLVQYACLSEASRFPFAYQIHAAVEVASPSDQCAPDHGGDSAVLTYWGVDAASAIPLGAGQSYTVTQTLQVQQVRPIPTVMTVSPVVINLNPLQLTLLTLHGRLTSAAGVPVVGRQVSFTTGASTVCSAVTDADGNAGCSGLAPGLAVLLGLGYTAGFAGDATYAPAQATAPLIH